MFNAFTAPPSQLLDVQAAASTAALAILGSASPSSCPQGPVSIVRKPLHAPTPGKSSWPHQENLYPHESMYGQVEQGAGTSIRSSQDGIQASWAVASLPVAADEPSSDPSGDCMSTAVSFQMSLISKTYELSTDQSHLTRQVNILAGSKLTLHV